MVSMVVEHGSNSGGGEKWSKLVWADLFMELERCGQEERNLEQEGGAGMVWAWGSP